MTVTFIGSGTGSTTPTLHASTVNGDYVIVAAYRDGSATPPTVPSGWQTCVTRAVSPSLVVACREKDASWTSIPAFTSAGRTVSVTVRAAAGKDAVPGVTASQGATSASIAWAVQTMQVNNGTSFVLRGFVGTRPDATPGTPANHTLIDANGSRPGYGTYRKNVTTDMAAATLTVSRSDVWSSFQVEFKEVDPPIPPGLGSGTASHDWTISASGITPIFVPAEAAQDGYQFYGLGTEAGSSPLGTESSPLSVDLSDGESVNTQLRFRLQSTNAVKVVNGTDFQLQWSYSGSGSWSNVGSTGAVLYYDAADLVESQVTTARLTPGTGGFAVGVVSETGFALNAGWAIGKYTELLYTVRFSEPDLSHEDVIIFRVVPNNTTVMTYTSYPEVDIVKIPGIPPNTGTSTGSYSFDASGSGVKDPKATATASYLETITAAGKKFPIATSTASWLETIAVASKRNPIATSTANHSWTSIAQGVKPVVGVKQGSAIASWATTGSATGKRTPKATATAAYFENVTATGSKLQRGTATVSWSEAISAQGKKTPVSTGTSSYLETITATGKKTPKAVTAANHSWTAIAQGFSPVVGQKQGTAIASWSETISATGKRSPKATSTTLYTENVTAAGKKIQKATATASWTESISAAGKKLQNAVATVAYLFAGSATGKKAPRATATANHSWTAIAQGIKPVVGIKQGTAIVSWAETSTAVGKRAPKATATASYLETVTVNGKKFLRGTATVSWTETITVNGTKPLRGSATVVWTELISVTGKRIPKSTSVVFHEWNVLADGKYDPIGLSTLAILWQLSAIGVGTRGITILNEADNIHLGVQQVDAIYVGSQKVWENYE